MKASLLVPVTLLVGWAGLGGPAAGQTPSRQFELPPRAIRRDLPLTDMIRRAYDAGTRDMSGRPGPNYWQPWTDYRIHSRLDTEAKRVDGTVHMVYHNNSPRPLPVLALQLIQNVHAEGAVRNREMEVTGGMEITRVVAGGDTLAEITRSGRPMGSGGGYAVLGTTMMLRVPRSVPSRDSLVLEVGYGFTIPEAGAGGRMGYNGGNLFYLAYWYPQMAVYDDVVGWHDDPFLGRAEFFMDFVPAALLFLEDKTSLTEMRRVVNSIGRLMGRITIDDVVDVIRDEAEKDYQLASGITTDVETTDSPGRLSRARLPWLMIGLLGGIVVSKVIGRFEADIQINPVIFHHLIGS